MYKLFNKKLTSLAIACTITSMAAMAFPTSHYARNSKLANGTWVKIAIPETGIYEITDEELTAMGFSNPSKVQVYGCGGNAINETLDGNYPDDLQPVNVGRYNGKLCFYGLGPVAMSIADARSTLPHYVRTNNTYSTRGYYFLHEANELITVDQMGNEGTRGTVECPSSLAYFLHEVDKTSVSSSGRHMLGEDIVDRNLVLDYSLPGLATNSVTVNVSLGVNTDQLSYAEAKLKTLGKDYTVNFPLDQSRIYSAVTLNMAYKTVSPVAKVVTDTISPEGKLNIYVNAPSYAETILSKLDYFILTYDKHNAITDGMDGQTRMGYASPTIRDCIMLPGASSTTVVWNVDDPAAPVQYLTSNTTDEENTDSIVGLEFTPHLSAKSTEYIAFDPALTLKKIESYEAVDNQNIHGMATPDMLIITDKVFMEQAQRIAQLHKDVDGLDVAVLDQTQIFNEFSSGTPDAMAYRLVCKMFYDRDKTKFKNLLLMGPGSFDNRGITTIKPNRLLTYQSEESSQRDGTFVSTDFFGFLDDNSGGDPSLRSDVLRIGVGLYPVTTATEAKSDVDKLIKYVANPDYGPWRNDALIMADTGNDDAHIFEADGVNNLIEEELGTGLNTNKVYVDMFQRSISDGKSSSEARRRITEYLQAGQYFATYVGHAGPLSFTTTNLWTSTTAQNTVYPHWPILTTACCEVARYDSDERGIAEHMFHAANGGAIAMVASPRLTINTENELMNRTFTSTVFSYAANGYMPTLGEAYMNMKQKYGTASNGNKLAYTLMGDPALRINYPKALFKFLTVNGTVVNEANGDITVAPMQEITVTAQVLKEGTNEVDTDFNGDATLTLYDAKRLLKTVRRTIITQTVVRDIYYPRDVLARVQGRVVNGLFTGTVMVPRHEKALYEKALLRLYAHQDGTDHMVNGQMGAITITQYNSETAIQDDNSPVIESMFLNDETTFNEGCTVPANSMLYITASDDIGINTQSASIGNSMKLLLDGGRTSYYQVKENAVASDNARHLEVAIPMEGLSEGAHTLTFTVFDVAGNSASRTISFIVSQSSNIVLTAQEMPATTVATIDVDCGNISPAPMVNLKVTDAHGNIVWTKSTSSFPTTWDLTDMNGNRVKPGLYKYMGNYDNGSNYGGTNIGDLIVIDPVKSNK